DALRFLASRGLIQARPHSGTTVQGIEHWNFLDPQIIEWARDMGNREGYFDMLVQARNVLELGVVEVAAVNAADKHIEELQAAYERMEQAASAEPPDLEGYNSADVDFHLTLLDATQNLILRQFGALMKAALLSAFETASRIETLSWTSIHAHKDVIEAIRRRDPEAARASMVTITGILADQLYGHRPTELDTSDANPSGS
ncbi:MAG: FCD domain-containing protein, partial [Rhodospirillales bacterium]|nr:FCD domain-containing protein [Rhodospirillales bacterium]